MSRISGQAEITITKPDGRQIKQVIHNDIEDGVYNALRAQIMGTENYFSTPREDDDLVPERMKIHLSTGGTWLAEASEISDGGLSEISTSVAGVTDHHYLSYSTKTPLPVGDEFTGDGGGLGGYVDQVELMAADGTTRIANATTGNTTFTATSDVSGGKEVDANDTVSCVYRLQIQSYTDTDQDYVSLLLGVIRGELNDITIHEYRVSTINGGRIQDVLQGSTLTAALVTSGTGNSFGITGSATFVKINQVPVGFEVRTASGVKIMDKLLSTGAGNTALLGGFVQGDTVTVPFEFTLNRLTSVAGDPSP